jgi:hypothetical protein
MLPRLLLAFVDVALLIPTLMETQRLTVKINVPLIPIRFSRVCVDAEWLILTLMVTELLTATIYVPTTLLRLPQEFVVVQLLMWILTVIPY